MTLFCLFFFWSVETVEAVPPGTIIENTAQALFRANSSDSNLSSNTVTITTTWRRTPSRIELLQYAPTLGSAEQVSIPTANYSPDGTTGSGVQAVAAIYPAGSSTAIDTSGPVPLIAPAYYHQGEPIFFRVTDGDQNMDPAAAETVWIQVTSDGLGDTELLMLTETGPDTGVFTGYLQSSGLGPVQTYNGLLDVADNAQVSAHYTDLFDSSDTVSASVLVDPYGLVFDSSTGQPVDNATISLIDAASGRPAVVYGDDGISTFPATITSGGTFTDSGGKVYDFDNGAYRFPFVAPGTYRLLVQAPGGYAAPSAVPTALLQTLPGAPFAIVEPGSRGEAFVLNPGPALRIDIPVDPGGPGLWIRKTVNREEASIGDFIQYRLTIENGAAVTASDIGVEDRLPIGFRFRKGSAHLDGRRLGDPQISPDGRTLHFQIGDLGDAASTELRYVTEIGAGARIGKAMNTARAASANGLTSNTAAATVAVKEDLWRSKNIVVGRVIADNCGDLPTAAADGVAGVRIYLEDGTYAISDEQGMYHFEGITSGTHVVQLDLTSLPTNYELSDCDADTRAAGTPFSRFIDLQGGTVWRADFHVRTKTPPSGEALLQMASQSAHPRVNLTASIDVRGVDLGNLRLSVILPPEVRYVEGTSRLDGRPAADPQSMGDVLIYRLGDAAAGRRQTLHFDLEPVAGVQTEAVSVRSILTFDAPTAKNQRTEAIETGLSFTENTSPHGEGHTRVTTRGALQTPANALAEIPAETAPSQDFEQLNLDSLAPGFGWLMPADGFYPAIPSVKIAVQHAPEDKIDLQLNGAPVNPFHFDGRRSDRQGRIAVSCWRGVDLKAGPNVLVAIRRGADGQEMERIQRTVHFAGMPFEAELVEAASHLVADGKAVPVIAVRLTDKEGHPARFGVLGEYQILAPYAAYSKFDLLRQGLPQVDAQQPRYTVGRDGIARIQLQPTTQTGQAVVRLTLDGREQEIKAWLRPEAREWILVGLAEGTAGYHSASGNMEQFDAADLKEDFYKDGRLAFFAKGKIKGSWLLTAAFDSDKDRHDPENRLFQTIDPESYYTLYGDATEQRYEAASIRKLYLKIERDRFYAMLGDYETGLTVTELSRYSRSFNGLKSEYHGDRFGYALFAAESGQAYVKDEIRGNGTSGLYHLSRRNIVVNSDKVTIETRDRFRSEIVLSSKSLTRFVDYSIDFDSGTLFFKSPVYSRDEGFNPVYIVVAYECEDGAQESYTYGGRGSARFLGDRVEVGATYVHEGPDQGEGDLGGLDLQVDLGNGFAAKAEVSTSQREAAGEKFAGEGYLAELSRRSANFDGRLYYRELGEGFGLGQQSGTEAATRKVGLDGAWRMQEKWTLNGEAYRSDNLATDARRDLAEANLVYRTPRHTLSAGLRTAEDRFDDGTVDRSTQLLAGVSRTFLDNRLQMRLAHEQSLFGHDDSVDFPTRTLIGADYKITEPLTLFAEHEITQGETQESQSSRFGFKVTPWNGAQVGTSLGRQTQAEGSRLFANLGLFQNWQVTSRWSLDAGLDRSQTIREDDYAPFNTNVPTAAGDEEDFTAATLGIGYKAERWSWTGRVEGRWADSQDKWGLITGVAGEVRQGLALSGGVKIFGTDTSAGEDTLDGDVRLSLAWRPKNGDWIIFDRLDYKFESLRDDSGSTHARRIVNHFNANYRPGQRLQMALQYGAKYVFDTIDHRSYSGYTDLTGLEVRYDLTRTWDLGLQASVLHSWQAGQTDYRTGVSVGHTLFKNAWISLGYNVTGFEDEDFSAADYTAKGPFVKFRIKFDQQSVRQMVDWFGR